MRVRQLQVEMPSVKLRPLQRQLRKLLLWRQQKSHRWMTMGRQKN